MSSKITTMIFDYGGTLDTGGIHWSEKFWEAYQYFHVPVSKEDFRNAFVFSEKNVQNIIESESGLRETYRSQLFYQLQYFEKNNLLPGAYYTIIDKLVEYCHRSVMNNVNESKMILLRLASNYKLGIVSNYYGNLITVLNEIRLKKFFSLIVDSKNVGVRKPDSKIFSLAIESINSNPDETIVVGDSYTNDISPSKQVGCKTIWLNVKSWEIPLDIKDADIIINSFSNIEEAINKLL
ncbi:MAG: HAD family hydrolase [Bacteroidota bacterium]